ncbi:hypothetical protein [Blastochloris tepida]|uniref:Uncharacterized protein n=1 Tax=Blastochloris tepida TaxID=2233851 RepID=A0A348FYT0_9HYPH|nr:hypothetical protein [Blastochloris tepida]BBF92463.1 hypothetical protein BLTE_11480 [Blastochloris tepida]
MTNIAYGLPGHLPGLISPRPGALAEAAEQYLRETNQADAKQAEPKEPTAPFTAATLASEPDTLDANGCDET